MHSIWHKLLEMFSNFWFKLLIEALVLVLFVGVTWLVRKYLPKKWWISRRKLGNFISATTALSEFIPDEEDNATTLTKKSFNIIEFVYSLGGGSGHGETKDKELIEFGKDLVEDVVARKDYFFMNSIFPLIESEATTKDFCYKCTDDVLNGVYKFTFSVDDPEHPGNKKDVLLYCFKSFSDYENLLGGLLNPSFLITKGYDHKLLSKLLYQKFGPRLYLMSNEHNKVSVQGIPKDTSRDNYLLDADLYEEIQTDIERFKTKNIQRSYLMFGPPGTGKSTFCLEATAKSGGTFVKLNKNFIENLESASAKSLLNYLRPSTIVIDDIDRISGSSNMQLLLQILEDAKTMEGQPVLMATANHLPNMDQAMLRPGRFDELIEFAAPDLEERQTFIDYYLKKLGVEEPNKDHVLELAKATNKMTQAFLKEYCYIYTLEGNSLEKALAKIEIRKKFLPKARKSNTEEETGDYASAINEDEDDDGDYDEEGDDDIDD